MSLQAVIIFCIGTSWLLKSCTCPTTPLAFIALLLSVGSGARPGKQSSPVSQSGGWSQESLVWASAAVDLVTCGCLYVTCSFCVWNGRLSSFAAAFLQLSSCQEPQLRPLVVLDLTERTALAIIPAFCYQHSDWKKRPPTFPKKHSLAVILVDNDDQTAAVKLHNARTALFYSEIFEAESLWGRCFCTHKSFEDIYLFKWFGAAVFLNSCPVNRALSKHKLKKIGRAHPRHWFFTRANTWASCREKEKRLQNGSGL